MKDLEIGQVLALRIRFNNDDVIAEEKHPCLIVKILEDQGEVEIAHVDSLEGKEFMAAKKLLLLSSTMILLNQLLTKIVMCNSTIFLE